MFTTRPTLQGTFGMVSSTHWLASQSAMAVLEDGGNAYDAAVAGAFVLHVVEPHLNGPAGEVPILLAPAGGEVRVLCGQGGAPAGATIAHYRGLGLDLVPGTGPLAAATWISATTDDRGVLDVMCGTAGAHYDKFLIPAGGCRQLLSDSVRNQEQRDGSGNVRTVSPWR